MKWTLLLIHLSFTTPQAGNQLETMYSVDQAKVWLDYGLFQHFLIYTQSRGS